MTSALEIFEARGYAESSLEEIAEQAGYTRKAIYSNFSGKSELLLEIVERRFQSHIQRIEAVLDEETSPERKTIDVGSMFADYLSRGVRRDPPEQRVLLTDHTEVRDTLAAVDEHHREITNHPSRVMTTTPLLEPSQPPRERGREPHHLSDLSDERGTRMRNQTRSIRRNFYAYQGFTTQ